MSTLNQITNKFIEFFNNHIQINTVIYSDDFDFAAYPNLVYGVVHLKTVDSIIKGSEIIHRFKLMVADIENPNNENSENEIYSDCELIADDFLTFFGDDDYEDFLMDTDSTFQRFSESGTDRTAGIVFTCSVRQTRDINPCAIPTKDNLSNQTEIFDPGFSQDFW